VDVSYPEIAGAVAFNAAVRQIVDPLLATLKNAHDLPGYLKSKFTANTLKNGTVSVLLEWEQYYRGAAHPALEMASVNYDTHEGRVLALADLFGPGVDYLPTLSRLAIAKLERQGRPQELTSPEWIRKQFQGVHPHRRVPGVALRRVSGGGGGRRAAKGGHIA